MLMRYHWGLAVGHIYTHQQQCTDAGVAWSNADQCFPFADDIEELQPDQMATEEHINLNPGTDDSGSDSDDDDWIPSDTDESLSSDSDRESLQDVDGMYGDYCSDDEYEG